MINEVMMLHGITISSLLGCLPILGGGRIRRAKEGREREPNIQPIATVIGYLFRWI
jgi:hypothetical protein